MQASLNLGTVHRASGGGRLLVVLLAASAAVPSVAAEPPGAVAASDAEGSSGEIVVTARRRAENVQDVPIELSGGSIVSVNASGGRLPGVSKYAISYGGEYHIATGLFAADGEFYLGVDGILRSDFSSSPTPSNVENIEGNMLTNLRAGYRTPKGYEIFGWVRNAFDTRYFDFLTAAQGSTGLIVGQPGDPRTYGVDGQGAVLGRLPFNEPAMR